MADTAPTYLPPIEAATTPDERTMATLAHVLQLVGGWIAPLVIFLVKRPSRFISFHALQVLLLQAIYLLVMIAVMLLFVVVVVLGIVTAAASSDNGANGAPALFFLFIPFFWMSWLAMWVVMLVSAIIYGMKAGRGEWAEYPVVGRYARQILKIGPGGAPMQP
jgi:uncharacterized protein